MMIEGPHFVNNITTVVKKDRELSKTKKKSEDLRNRYEVARLKVLLIKQNK